MDVRDALTRLDEPDPRAVERVWTRFERTRRGRRPLWLGLALAGLTVATLVAVTRPEPPRALDVTDGAVAWSDVVRVDAVGDGQIVGTDRDAVVAWRAGTVDVSVTPDTGTRLAVVTDEARVEVVGTEFSVRRDALGSTVTVRHGRVRVACGSGWTGDVTPEDPPRTCPPVTAAGWLGRADALTAQDADGTAVDEAIARGLELAGPGPIAGELLARRIERDASRGDVDRAAADGQAYLDGGYGGRDAEVRRIVGWAVLRERGCAAAKPWIEPLARAGAGPESVLLAECEPAEATRWLAPVRSALDPEWRARADAIAE